MSADYDNSFEHRYSLSRPALVFQDRLRTKRCERCGTEYIGTVAQKYCKPCAPIMKLEAERRGIARAKAKAQASSRAKKEQKQQ